MRNRRQRLRPILDQLDDRCLLSGYSPLSTSGYTPSQISSAYGLNAITFTSSSGSKVKGDGSGETIALIELYSDPNILSDLSTFDARYNLPNPSLTVLNQAGSRTDSGWAQEQALDVEWAHSIAPGANILLVQAAPADTQTQELQNLLNAVNAARNTAGVVAVSMELGVQMRCPTSPRTIHISRPRRAMQVSPSSPRAETAGLSSTQRHLPMSFPSEAPRSI